MEINNLNEANPWWGDRLWHEKDFHLENLRKQKIFWRYKIFDSFDEGIYSLRGPRQVGKTTFIKEKIKGILQDTDPKNVLFFSCDNINKQELEEIINLFLDSSDDREKFIFLDEIPFVNEWELVIKHFYDSGKFRKCFVLLCGSNLLDIKRSVERLPGREGKGKRHFIMQPLSFKEYLQAIGTKIELFKNEKKDLANLRINFKKINNAFLDYLLTGGFLKIINEYHETKKISDSSYDVYLKWIIGDLTKFGLTEKYAKQILRRVMETYTSEVSWSSLHSGTDIDTHNTTSKYSQALEDMFILNIIYKMEYNKKIPDYPKSKKIYISDPFLISCAYKWVNSLEDNFNKYKEYLEKNIAKICEGIFLTELIKYLEQNSSSDVFSYNDVVFYWTNKTKTKEIDFIYNNIAFEIKYQNQISKEDYKAFREFKSSYLITKELFDENTYPLSVFLIILDRFIKSNSTQFAHQ
jgi:hypothetical protein